MRSSFFGAKAALALLPKFAEGSLPPEIRFLENNRARNTLPKEKPPVRESAFRPLLAIFVQKINKLL
jgi:hypothetical protein